MISLLSDIRSPLRVVLPVGLFGIAMFLAIIISARTGVSRVEQNVPLVDACMTVKYELSLFHNSFEHSLYVNKEQDMRAAWKHLDNAKWYGQAMLAGGKGPDGTYVPLEDPALRRELGIMLNELDGLRIFAEGRLRVRPETPAGLETERRFDDLLSLILRQADAVEAALQRSISGQLAGYRAMTAGLLASCLLFTFAVGVMLYRYERRKDEQIAALDESERLLMEHERQLALSRAYLQSVMDNVAEPIVVIDQGYRVTMMNQAAARASNHWPPGPGEGPLMCYDVFHDRDLPCAGSEHPCPLDHIREAGCPITVEHEHRMADGSLRIFEIKASPLNGPDGSFLGIIESMWDMTERKLAERQTADFYAMLTHDLKSPLTLISGYAELLSEGAFKADDEAREMISAIRAAGTKLARMIDDFLALSRIEAGSKMDVSQTDIAATLREVQSEFDLAAAEKGLSFKTEIVDVLPSTLVDKRCIVRAVTNLLSNAFNYTPKGGAVTMTAEEHSGDEGDFIVISVTDTGPGIPPSEQAKIFEKYYRSPKVAGLKGTGLGLAIVKAVAEAHGGRVEVESAEGRGSTFRLLLPVRKTEPDRQAA